MDNTRIIDAIESGKYAAMAWRVCKGYYIQVGNGTILTGETEDELKAAFAAHFGVDGW